MLGLGRRVRAREQRAQAQPRGRGEEASGREMQYLPYIPFRAPAAPGALRGQGLPWRGVDWGQGEYNHDARGRITLK